MHADHVCDLGFPTQDKADPKSVAIVAVCLVLVLILSARAAAYDEPIRRMPPVDVFSDAPVPTLFNFDRPVAQQASLFGFGDWRPTILPWRLNAPPALIGPLNGGEPQPAEPPDISPYKNGFFQKLLFSGTWLEGGRVGDLRITEVVLSSTVVVPLPTVDHPLLITPGFETRLLHGPLAPDVPGQVFSTYVRLLWVPRINDRWSFIIGFEPGVHSDFDHSDADSLRLQGGGIVRYEWTPGILQVAAGIVYLDREDVKLVPAGGIVWTPANDLRFDLIVPQPRIAKRIGWDQQSEYWLYLGGEFGGGSWSVRRASGRQDILTLRDFRVRLGIERNFDGGAGWQFELGYVFGRSLRYASLPADIDLGGTLMLRGVLAY